MAAVVRCDLRLSDVLATADTVGREFRELTDRFGMQCTERLVPPVVRSLEWLEAYVESYQQLQTTVSELEMENDTLEYEREQRALLTEKNEGLTATIRELQKENRCLLMELDELHFKSQELSVQLEKIQSQELHTTSNSDLVIVEELSPVPPTPSPPPHSPNRVVHLSQIYTSPPSSHSPNFTPSPPPTFPISSPEPSLNTPTPTPTLQSQSHTSQDTHSPGSQDPPSFPHTLPVSPLPSPTLHPRHHPSSPPATRDVPATRAYRVMGRSLSVSDTVGMRVQTFPLTHHHCHHEEDMFERSRVTRRLSKVETELEMTSQQLGDLQRSRERLMDENKQLKIQVEKLKAEVSLESITSECRERPVKEAPRYYKEDVLQVLTEKNQLKEQLHTLQEELDQLRDDLKKTATGTRSRARSAFNGVTVIANGQHRKRRVGSVRSVLTESIKLDSYPNFQPCTNGTSHITP